MTIAHVGGSSAYARDTDNDVNVNCAAGSGSDVMIIAAITQRAATKGTWVTPTCDGNNMTQLKLVDPDTYDRLAIYAYPAGNNPGTLNVVASVTGSATNDIRLGVAAYTGCAQSSFIDQSGYATAVSNTPNCDLTPTVDGTVIIGACLNLENIAPTTSETEIYKDYQAGAGSGASYYIQATAGLYNMDWVLGGDADETWWVIVANIKAAAGGGDLSVAPSADAVTVGESVDMDMPIDVSQGADNYDNWVQGLRITQ